MDTFFRFLYEFLMQFFSGVQILFKGIWDGCKQAFNIKNYVEVVHRFKNGAIKKIYKIAVEEVQNPDDAKYFEDIGRKLLGIQG